MLHPHYPLTVFILLPLLLSWKIILPASKAQHRAQAQFLYIAAAVRGEPAVIFTASGLSAISFSIDSPLEPIDFSACGTSTWGRRTKRQRILPQKFMFHHFLFPNSSGFQDILRCRHQGCRRGFEVASNIGQAASRRRFFQDVRPTKNIWAHILVPSSLFFKKKKICIYISFYVAYQGALQPPVCCEPWQTQGPIHTRRSMRLLCKLNCDISSTSTWTETSHFRADLAGCAVWPSSKHPLPPLPSNRAACCSLSNHNHTLPSISRRSLGITPFFSFFFFHPPRPFFF